MLNIALAQINCRIGDFEKNIFTVKKNIQQAREAGADLVVFPELCVCGYPPRDFLEFSDFISKCKNAVDEIAKECTGIAVIVGAPSLNPKREGKNLFNCAYFLADGKINKW